MTIVISGTKAFLIYQQQNAMTKKFFKALMHVLSKLKGFVQFKLFKREHAGDDTTKETAYGFSFTITISTR